VHDYQAAGHKKVCPEAFSSGSYVEMQEGFFGDDDYAIDLAARAANGAYPSRDRGAASNGRKMPVRS
jgi:hypothetical protein